MNYTSIVKELESTIILSLIFLFIVLFAGILLPKKEWLNCLIFITLCIIVNSIPMVISILNNKQNKNMKQSNLTFLNGFLGKESAEAKKQGKTQKVFDWDKAAQIIKDRMVQHPDLIAEAGLQGDWSYTGGTIYENKIPVIDSYTYLSSNWAIPTLILSWDDEEQEEIQCFVEESESRFKHDSKWDETSLNILNNNGNSNNP